MSYTKRIAYLILTRGLVLSIILISLFDINNELDYILDNLVTVALWFIGVLSVLFLIITQLIDPKYAIQTEPKELGYYLSKPFSIVHWAIIATAVSVALVAVGVASYFTGAMVLMYAISMCTWPVYIRKIDEASKIHMMETLQKSA